MNKLDASSLLKEVLTKCELGKDTFILVAPDPKDTLSTGYKLKVKTAISQECRKRLIEVSKKHNLAVIEEHTQITIYKPASKEAGSLDIR